MSDLIKFAKHNNARAVHSTQHLLKLLVDLDTAFDQAGMHKNAMNNIVGCHVAALGHLKQIQERMTALRCSLDDMEHIESEHG